MATLIIETQHQLPVVLGASGHVLRADGAGAETWRGGNQRTELQKRDQRDRDPDKSFGEGSDHVSAQMFTTVDGLRFERGEQTRPDQT